jgi:hypothetical protein
VGARPVPDAFYESVHNRPPLTAIVVHKQGGRPGGDFREVMKEADFAGPGEGEEMWRRALGEVFDYWRP